MNTLAKRKRLKLTVLESASGVASGATTWLFAAWLHSVSPAYTIWGGGEGSHVSSVAALSAGAGLVVYDLVNRLTRQPRMRLGAALAVGRPNRDPNARPGTALKPPAGHTPRQPVAKSKPRSKPQS